MAHAGLAQLSEGTQQNEDKRAKYRVYDTELLSIFQRAPKALF